MGNEDFKIEEVFDLIASRVYSYLEDKQAKELIREIKYFGELRYKQGLKNNEQRTN